MAPYSDILNRIHVLDRARHAGAFRLVLGTIAAVLTLLATGCNGNEARRDTFTSSRIGLPALTCVTLSPDSATLLLGSSDSLFTRFNPVSLRREDYPLPGFTQGFSTYDIVPLSGRDEWLVAKRNCGLLYVAYDVTPGGREIRHVCRIAAPSRPLPAKDTHYSVYSVIQAPPLIAIGSSNGLMYLDGSQTDSLRHRSRVEASFVAPLVHLRKDRYQFAQEAMFSLGDSLVTVTDNGIYKIAFTDFADAGATYRILADGLRCHNAAVRGDTLAVLCNSIAARNDSPRGGEETRDGVFSEAMEKCARELAAMASPVDMQLPERLKWVAKACVVTDLMTDTVAKGCREDIRKTSRECPDFSFGNLAEMWNKWVPLRDRGGSNRILGRTLDPDDRDLLGRAIGSKFKKTDEERQQEKIERTLVLTAISFFGCPRPTVDGLAADIDKRSMLRTDSLKHLGTAYRFWAEQLSDGLLNDERTAPVIPQNEADILWMMIFPNILVTPGGSEASDSEKISLARGIRMAYLAVHGLTPEAGDPAGPEKRKPGRPKSVSGRDWADTPREKTDGK